MSISRSRYWADGNAKSICTTLGSVDHSWPRYPNDLYRVTKCSNWTDQYAHISCIHLHQLASYDNNIANEIISQHAIHNNTTHVDNIKLCFHGDALLHISVVHGNLKA